MNASDLPELYDGTDNASTAAAGRVTAVSTSFPTITVSK